jgi:hypothetical protein
MKQHETAQCVTGGLVAAFRVLVLAALCWATARAQAPQKEQLLPYLETHVHLKADYREAGRTVWDFEAAALEAIKSMDRLGIRQCFLLPPPFAPDNPTIYAYDKLREVCDRHPQRFAFLAGGETLNPMIQQALREGQVTARLRREFAEQAERIARDGAAGFGEMTALHLSFRQGHSFESAPPDHPLFLLLAEIAGKHKMPIDLHMEAVAEDMALPQRFQSPPNPPRLKENISGLERLLSHERKTPIVWAHVGWDNTGHGTVALYRRLLQKHPNLYLQLKVYRDSIASNQILADGRIKAEWLDLIRAFPERFVLGSDNFYGIPGKTRLFPDSQEGSRQILENLPADLARRVGNDNVKGIYRMK